MSLHFPQQNRFVLSGNEIKKYLEENLSDKSLPINKPNLYFHLNYLKDNNLIQIVDFYGQSRNVSAYYGRTAKMYLLNEEKEKAELSILKKKDFEDFLLQLNPEIPSNEIKSTINKVMGFGKNDFSEIISWLETNMKYFGSSDEVNQHSIFNLMLFLRIHDSEIFDAITELKSLLKL